MFKDIAPNAEITEEEAGRKYIKPLPATTLDESIVRFRKSEYRGGSPSDCRMNHLRAKPAITSLQTTLIGLASFLLPTAWISSRRWGRAPISIRLGASPELYQG